MNTTQKSNNKMIKVWQDEEGRFWAKDDALPEEIIVNAVTHRAYNITGTDIQVKMFDDRIVVESPGKLPGLVRAENIRHTHFSRNPRIAEYLKAYKFVKEYGEGVNRMCNEMESIGLKAPVYRCNDFILQTIIYNANAEEMSKADKFFTTLGKLAIGETNISKEIKKLAIQDEKLAIGSEKLAIHKINWF